MEPQRHLKTWMVKGLGFWSRIVLSLVIQFSQELKKLLVHLLLISSMCKDTNPCSFPSTALKPDLLSSFLVWVPLFSIDSQFSKAIHQWWESHILIWSLLPPCPKFRSFCLIKRFLLVLYPLETFSSYISMLSYLAVNWVFLYSDASKFWLNIFPFQ